MRTRQLTLMSIVLLSILCLSSSVMAYLSKSIPLSSSGHVVYTPNNFITEFYSGRDYGACYVGYVSPEVYHYVNTFCFASLTPTGDLIPRDQSIDGWGNTGVDWHGVESMVRKIALDFKGYPILRIWLMNLDKSDDEWNAENRNTPMNLTNPQPKISYAAIEAFLSHLENLTESVGLESLIFIPCWEFNQVGCSELANRRDWCWSAGGSYRDWDINPSDYNTFMQILVQARNKVAPRIRIGVAPDGMAGAISWTSENPDWNDAWNRTWGGRDGFSYWLDGFEQCNFSFDVFGVSQYPRLAAINPLQNSSILMQNFLGEQWNKRIVDLIGLQGKPFFLYEFNCWDGSTGTGNGNFVANTYQAVIRSIDQGIVLYGSICWYMGFSANGLSVCNQLAQQYYGYKYPS